LKVHILSQGMYDQTYRFDKIYIAYSNVGYINLFFWLLHGTEVLIFTEVQ
jgi:hypothetical protein